MLSFEEWKRRKMRPAMVDASLDDTAGDLSAYAGEAVDDAELPGTGPEYEGHPEATSADRARVRRPLGAAAPTQTSGDDERDAALSATPGEQSVLDDKRASASQQMGRQYAQNMSNVFLTAAGLPAQSLSDSYVSERDKMRQWVLQRGQAKRGEEMQGLQAERTKAYLDATQAQRERDLAIQAQRAEAEGRKEDAEKARLELEREKLKRQGEQFDATTDLKKREIDLKEKAERRKGMAKPPKGPTVPERRQQMREDALKPRAGWEKIVETDPAFRDPQQAKAFDDSVAAYEALRNHRQHAKEALLRFKNAKTLAEKDNALAEANQQMANIASKLRVAEGLNNSDAANQAVEHMLGLVNGSVVNFRNAINDGRVDAILDSAINSAGTNLDTTAASNNLRRSKTAAKSVEPGGVVKVRRKKDGAVKSLTRDQAAKVLASPDYEEADDGED